MAPWRSPGRWTSSAPWRAGRTTAGSCSRPSPGGIRPIRPRWSAALAIPARDYLRAMRVRRLMAQAYDDFLKPFDAVATPTRATVASPLDKAFRDAYPDVKGGVSLIGSSNVVGVPGISVPSGFGLNGLPTGLSFVTRAFDELKLVRLGRLYQSHTDWHTQRPPVP